MAKHFDARGRTASRHLPVLDGLRGLAILAVITYHVKLDCANVPDTGVLGRIFEVVSGWGWAGVDLFFVLSGFLITGILYDAKGCDGYFRIFYARRTLRIMPLYFGFVLFLIVLSRLAQWSMFPWISRAKDLFPWISRSEALALCSYTYNFHIVFMKSIPHLSFFWSLAVEEHFYLFWPLFVWSMSRRSLMRLCAALAATSLLLRLIVIQSGAWPLTAYYATPCRLDGLLAGAFVALAWRDPVDFDWVCRNACWALSVSGILLLGMVIGQATVHDGLVLTFGIAALAVFFAGLVVLALDAVEGGLMQRLLGNDGLQSVGKYSYGIYMFHSQISWAGVGVLSSLIHLPGLISKSAALVWASGAGFAVAWLSYHLFEKRFLRLKRVFEYREHLATAFQPPHQSRMIEQNGDPDTRADLSQFGASATEVEIQRLNSTT